MRKIRIYENQRVLNRTLMNIMGKELEILLLNETLIIIFKLCVIKLLKIKGFYSMKH
jgi:hypothetical protein